MDAFDGLPVVNDQQRKAAYRLLAAVESDPELKAEAKDYGNWYAYLYAHVIETDSEDDLNTQG